MKSAVFFLTPGCLSRISVCLPVCVPAVWMQRNPLCKAYPLYQGPEGEGLAQAFQNPQERNKAESPSHTSTQRSVAIVLKPHPIGRQQLDQNPGSSSCISLHLSYTRISCSLVKMYKALESVFLTQGLGAPTSSVVERDFMELEGWGHCIYSQWWGAAP